ncbi:MAG: glycosyltransferase [Patescibacteria group bacterium]
MKVALVHDHLNQIGGAEKVLEVFSDMFPKAPIYTLIFDPKKIGSFLRGKKINESVISRLPLSHLFFRWYLPLMPAATEGYDLRGYDLVLSDSSGMAKGVLTHSKTIHICYCHTPTRYLWSDATVEIDPLEKFPIIGRISQLFRSYLRMWDRLSVDRVDYFIANSKFVAERIKKYYKKDSVVIYPPVDLSKCVMSEQQDKYFVIVGRMRPYKRFDLAVKAFNRLGIPLKIIGGGEELAHLRENAKPNIEFLGSLPDREKFEIISRAQALIHPQEEDFGITAIEAMGCGRPVIAFDAGGAKETVVDGQTGVLFDEQSWESLGDAVIRFRSKDYDSRIIRAHAEKFGVERFKREISDFIQKCINEPKDKVN